MISSGLLDTSVLIGVEAGQLQPGDLPEVGAISTMTIAELHLGVLLAEDGAVRARRLQTLVFTERTYEALVVSTEVARQVAELVATLRQAGRRAPVVDTIIAATAIAHGLALYSQDAGFSDFPGLETVLLA